MKVAPLTSYREPAYPTRAAARAQPDLLQRLPQRWADPRFTRIVGASFALRALLTPDDDAAAATEKSPAVAQAPGRPGTVTPDAAAQKVQQASAVVAPILADALEHDGRGSFGCVAINPPTFLPEDEALDLIQAELRAAGLQPVEFVPMAGVLSPAGAKAGAEQSAGAFERRMSPRLAPGTYTFACADTNRAVYVEYLSRRKFLEWSGPSMSTADSYNFPELARQVAGSLGQTRVPQRTVFGVFFDPLAHPGGRSPEADGLTNEQWSLVSEEFSRARHASAEEMAKRKLQKQVQHFIDYLRQQGIVASAP